MRVIEIDSDAPAGILCRVDYRGNITLHDPEIPYNTLQTWSFCQLCGLQIARVSREYHWYPLSFEIVEWP